MKNFFVDKEIQIRVGKIFIFKTASVCLADTGCGQQGSRHINLTEKLIIFPKIIFFCLLFIETDKVQLCSVVMVGF